MCTQAMDSEDLRHCLKDNESGSFSQASMSKSDQNILMMSSQILERENLAEYEKKCNIILQKMINKYADVQ